jgi:zinc transporter ZupT
LAKGYEDMTAFLYALITSAGTIVCGILPLYTKIKLIDKRYLIGFAGGVTVAIALFDLIPEMKTQHAYALLLGFFIIYLLEKVILVHSCIEEDCESHTIGATALIGIATESLIDGLAIATAYRLDPSLGILVALSVFIHEVPRGMTTAIIMQEAGYSKLRIWGALAIDAGFAPIGVLLSNLIPASGFDPLIGFAAGIFIYIGASDLIPEAHRRFNPKVIVSTLMGAAIILVITILIK